MESTAGVMQQIRDLLAQGMSSRQVIGKGYAPGTVYKAQRQVRRQAPGQPHTEAARGQRTAIIGQSDPVLEALIDRNDELEAENSRLAVLHQERSSEIEALKGDALERAAFIQDLRQQVEMLQAARRQAERDTEDVRRELQAARRENWELQGCKTELLLLKSRKCASQPCAKPALSPPCAKLALSRPCAKPALSPPCAISHGETNRQTCTFVRR